MGRILRSSRCAVALGVAVTVVLSACDSSIGHAAVVRVHGTPVVADALSPPGSPRGDGFDVPPGTRLVGAVLPDDPATGYPNVSWRRAWTALLLVRGDASAAVDALLTQAARHGLPTEDPTMSCYEYGCSVGAARPSVGRDRPGVSRGLSIVLSPRASLLRVEYRDPDPSAAAQPVPAPQPVRFERAALEPVRLPRAGSVLNLTLNSESVRVQPGSTVLAPPFCDACFGGDLVLMRPGHGRRVLDGYARATRKLNAWEDIWHRTQQRGRWTVTTRGFGNTDAGVVFELFEASGQPDSLRLTLANGA
jgi:hypothetical protein